MTKLISAIPPLMPTNVTDLTTGEVLAPHEWVQPVQALLEYVQQETKYLYATQYEKFERDVLVVDKLGSMNSFARQRGYKSRYKTNLTSRIKAQSRVNELVLHKFASETASHILNPNPKKQPPTYSLKLNLGAVDKQMVTLTIQNNVLLMIWKVWDHELLLEFTLPSYILKRNILKISLPTVEYQKGNIVFIFTVQELPAVRPEGTHLAGLDLGRVEPYTIAVATPSGKRVAHYTTSPRLKQLNLKRENLLAEKKHILNKIKTYDALGLNTDLLVKEKQYKANKIKAIGLSLAQQLGAEVTQKLNKHKVSILNVENLKWATGAKYGSRWNHSQQQSSMEHALLRSGVKTKRVNPKNSSQNCYMCGSQVVHNAKRRTVYCAICKTELDRDFNAAMNIASDNKRYPTMNRVSGGNCSVTTQVAGRNGSNSTIADKTAIASFIT